MRLAEHSGVEELADNKHGKSIAARMRLRAVPFGNLTVVRGATLLVTEFFLKCRSTSSTNTKLRASWCRLNEVMYWLFGGLSRQQLASCWKHLWQH